MRKTRSPPKPKNRTVVQCTDSEQRVKAVIVNKSENELTVHFPSGAEMLLSRPTPQKKLYVCRIGLLEFVSDGWPIV
jgi:hypothetical protein